jgi:hypothetical protein
MNTIRRYAADDTQAIHGMPVAAVESTFDAPRLNAPTPENRRRNHERRKKDERAVEARRQ